ncbi:MAG: DoxX family protein [Cyclobacteriaceae bacterium]
MVNTNSQSPGVWYDGIALVRIMVGVLLIFHGLQLFESQDMNGFADVLFNMSVPFPEAMAYTGKIVELIGGGFLILGLFTRLMTALLFLTFMFITFVMGEGKIFTDNQHPFLFAMMSLLFFFTGAGRLSIDYILFINKKEDKKDTGMSVSKRFGRYVSKS